MKFAERLKSDKGFRWKAIFIFIAVVLVIGNTHGEVKKEAVTQEQCNKANTGATILPDGSSYCGWSQSEINLLGNDICMDINQVSPTNIALQTCTANLCEVGRKSRELGGKDFLAVDVYGCFTCVPSGVRAVSKDACCSKESEKISDGGTYDDLCISSGEDDPNKPSKSAVCGNDIEKTLAGFLDPVEFADDYTCKQKYYLTTFGGGALLLLFVLAAL